jgi:hypothetical protein
MSSLIVPFSYIVRVAVDLWDRTVLFIFFAFPRSLCSAGP